MPRIQHADINGDLKLEVGDRFRVRCTNATPFLDCPDGDMIALTGTWLTVTYCSKKKEERGGGEATVYGYSYSVQDEDNGYNPSDYEWFWCHMDLVERDVPLPGIITETLPNI